MKPLLIMKAVLLLFLFSFSACNTSAPEQVTTADTQAEDLVENTTIYFVRHAEKDTTDKKNEDPDLTPAGRERAEALRTLLQDVEIDALYATKYIRTKNTLKPLAAERNLEVRQYEGHDFQGLKERVLQEHAGETVVVAGHSNTLLPLVEAFSVEKPFEEIKDEEYFYLFKVVVDQENKAVVEVTRFGLGA